MKKAIVALCLSLTMVGCIIEPKIESTKPWEGHYYTIDDLKKQTDSIVLDKNESIWIMSNHTLNRLLKMTK